LCDANRGNLVEHVGEFVGILNGLEGFVEEGELAKVLESVASVVQALEVERIVEPILVSLIGRSTSLVSTALTWIGNFFFTDFDESNHCET